MVPVVRTLEGRVAHCALEPAVVMDTYIGSSCVPGCSQYGHTVTHCVAQMRKLNEPVSDVTENAARQTFMLPCIVTDTRFSRHSHDVFVILIPATGLSAPWLLLASCIWIWR